jgi:1,4-alpha-glucan branching enzyme
MSFEGMGAVLDEASGSCGFRVWAPHAREVFVTGPFCGWKDNAHPLTHEGNGYWAGSVQGVGAGAAYKFVFQNGRAHWRVDAYARDVDTDAQNVFHGLVVDRSASWAPFSTPRFADLIVYQLHVGSYAGHNDGVQTHSIDSGKGWVATCDQIVPKLDYIRGLGFNAIALLPIGEVPRNVNQAHMGYAPTDWFAPETDIGSPADVRQLVDEAHKRGISVIFDLVYNHASIDDNHYWNYDGYERDGGIYFEGGGDSTFGRVPAHWKREVRAYFLDNARMWLEDYRGDGLRFDAAHCVQWESLQHIIFGLRQNPFWRDKLMVAEWTGDDRDNWKNVINDIGFNSVWGMSGPYAFREAIRRGVFGGDAVDSMLSVMELEPYRNHWNIIRYYLGSHDQIRDPKSGAEGDHRYPVEKFGGRENWTARAQCRMGWALNVTVPGIPMLFMGCEGHLPGYWWPTLDQNPSHGDHRMDWSKVGDPLGAPMQALVRAANRMRWEHSALRSHSLDVTHTDRQNNVLAFRRWNEQGDVVLTIANFSEREWLGEDYAVRTGAGGSWQEIFNSQAPEFDGYADSGNGSSARHSDAGGYVHIRLPKWSVLCFKQV